MLRLTQTKRKSAGTAPASRWSPMWTPPNRGTVTLRSIFSSRHGDWGDETVAASADVDDEAIAILTVTQRATQR